MTGMPPRRVASGTPRRSRASIDSSISRVAITVVVGASLAACDAGLRPGPLMDPGASAPFLTAGGPSPMQGEAQAAVDAAVRRDGVRAVFPELAAAAPSHLPIRMTLFACGPGPVSSEMRVHGASPSATCHVDVMDRDGGLLGRSTMTFRRDGSRWTLADVREREFDAR